MITVANRETYLLLAEVLMRDFDLATRRLFSTQDPPHVEDASTALTEIVNGMSIVYTAFDGDHQQLTEFMRAFVVRKGHVPANPESILGYKETVTARQAKRGVLLDDLAVLRRCDQLWVFTEEVCAPESVQNLAEGIIVELLYFLKRHRDPQVHFVSPLTLLRGEDPTLVRYQYTYKDTESALDPIQYADVIDLANSGSQVDRELPSIIYHIYDPLDFKYTPWLRERAYDTRTVPLVPGLAVQLQDIPNRSPESLASVLVAWATLTRLAASAYMLPPFDRRSPSGVAGVLEHVWVRYHGSKDLQKKDWRDYKIPKAVQGPKWPLTRKEGAR